MQPNERSSQTTVRGDRAPRDSKSELVRQAERDVRSPLAALRVLLECTRPGHDPLTSASFVDRALDEIDRVERAAADLVAWTSPRPLRVVRCSVDELLQSLRASLDPSLVARCDFALEDEDATLEIDARVAAETLTRTVRHALERHTAGHGNTPGGRVMIHGHSDEQWTTISIVEAPPESDRSGAATHSSTASQQTLAEALMTRDIHRLGGRASMHQTGEHRCYVVLLPRVAPASERGVA